MRGRPATPCVPARRVRRRLAAGVLALASALGTVAATGASATARGETDPAPVPTDVTMVQANIETGMPVADFQADVATVLARQPDFVTYNEVHFRKDAVIAPDGYDVYRSMRNRYTAETAVVWRSDRWTAIDAGTFRISNYRGVPRGREVELGRRFANWVTLQGLDGRVLSVVATHVAPPVREDPSFPDLLRHSVIRLGQLVEQLAPSGPVLVGGDFNVQYNGPRYPRDLLTSAGLVPTYDTLGTKFRTHYKTTIDYIFDRGVDVLTAQNHAPIKLNSDHRAVVAGLDWATDAPADTQMITSDPDGDRAAQRAALDAVLDGLRSAQPGALVELATDSLELPAVVRQLRRALDRGVHVRVTTASEADTRLMRRLSRAIAAHADSQSWLRSCPGCGGDWRDAGVPRGFLMVGDPSGAWVARYDTNRKLTRVLVERKSRAWIRTGSVALDEGERLLGVLG